MTNKTQVRCDKKVLRKKKIGPDLDLSNICVLSKDKEVNKSLSERVEGEQERFIVCW